MVLFGHVQHEVSSRQLFAASSFREFSPIFWAGGVDIFFIVSGFIMFHLWMNQFGGDNQPSEFMLRRIIRVGPPYWLFSVAMLLAIFFFPYQIAHPKLLLGHIVSSFFFLPVRNPYGTYFPLLILGWTLNFEMMFYIIFSVGLFFSCRFGVALIVATLWLLGLVGALWRNPWGPLAFWCDPIVIEFTFGMWLAYLRAKGCRWRPPIGALVVVVGFATMVVLKKVGIAGNYWIYRPFWIGLPALLVCMGPALVDEADQPGEVKRLLARGGNVSFALYLSHPFSIGIATLVFTFFQLTDGWTDVAATSLAAVAAAFLVHDWVERPMTEALLKFLRARGALSFQTSGTVCSVASTPDDGPRPY